MATAHFERLFLHLIAGEMFSSGSFAAGTEAGGNHVQVDASCSELQALADERGLQAFAAVVDAAEQALQGPEIVVVDLGAGHSPEAWRHV